MMTKHLRIILALILLMAVSAAKASTLYYVVDNIRYAVNTDDKTAMVVAYDAYKDMTEITIPASITEDGVTYRVTYIDSKCFKDCSSLASVNLPDGIHLKGGAFYHCTGLKSIKLPASIKRLPTLVEAGQEYGCFRGCSNLTNLTIPNTVIKLDQSCFADCTGLTNITIPSSVTSLPYSCFIGCTSLASIAIPNSVTGLGQYCFSGCTSLTSITIPNSVTGLGQYCFSGCTSLTSITIPNSVTFIGWGCFEGCTSLTSVTIPNSVTKMEERCFSGCTSLASITIPNSVTELGQYCFSGCTSLTSITIPNSVTRLGYNCFDGCTSLTSVTIPNSVTSLGGGCFEGCTRLKEVTCWNTYPPHANSVFEYDFMAEMTLYVPAASVEAYKTSDYDWKYFGKILPLSASGIKTVSKGDIGMSVDNGTLTLSNVPENEPVSVYSTTGQLLGTGKGNISVNAQGAQMVIVKVGGKSYKMLVK